MKHVDVKSSVIKSVAYENHTLEVRFHDGSVHRYHPVSPYQHASLLSADSVGKHFNTQIKPNSNATMVSAGR